MRFHFHPYYHPAYCIHNAAEQNNLQFFNRWKLQEKYWLTHPQNIENQKWNFRFDKERVVEAAQNHLKRFENKLKFMTRTHRYYKIFFNLFPSKKMNINNQTSTQTHKNVVLTTPSSATIVPKLYANDKSRSKNKCKKGDLAVIPNVEQLSTNQFVGDRKIVQIESLPPGSFNQIRKFGQMGDFHVGHFSQSSDQQQQQDHDTQSLLFSPVSTSEIYSDNYSLILNPTIDDGFNLRNLPKEDKQKYAKQLHIIQDKLQQDQFRHNLEFHPDIDKDWLVIKRQISEYQGNMTTLRRTIQYIHDYQIIIHQSLERSLLHRKLEDSAHNIAEFVKTLPKKKKVKKFNKRNKELPSPVGPVENVNLPLEDPQTTSLSRKPDDLFLPPLADVNNSGDCLVCHFQNQNLGDNDLVSGLKHEKNSVTPQTKTGDLWFARNYNFCESLEHKTGARARRGHRKNYRFFKKNTLVRFVRLQYSHIHQALTNRKNYVQHQRRIKRNKSVSVRPRLRNLVII